MKVIYGIGKVKKAFKNAVLAIGVFDGLHVGHQKLIKAATDRAKAIKGQALVMTFSPHPVHVLYPESYQPLIISLNHRLKVIKSLGVASCIVVKFTKRFSKLTPQKFIKRYLVDHIGPKEILVGDDFRFGQNRSGSLDTFETIGQKYGIKIHPVTTVKSRKQKVGSTQIRKLIAEGKLSQAEKYLGRCISVIGTVIKGDTRGASLGYPTANIKPEQKVIVPLGVYAVNIIIGKNKYQGMANVGFKPSFQKQKRQINIEAHIFNFNKKIYGKEIVIEFLKKIRNEKLFPTREQLIAQLKKDEQRIKRIFDLPTSSINKA